MLKINHSSDKFHVDGNYSCPVCRHGQISAMPLMEALSCDLCHHIFTADYEKQLLKMVDSQIPLTWYWNGKIWKGLPRDGFEPGLGYAIAGIIFVLLPTALVGIATYLFPPIPGSHLYWLPTFWIILTFVAHISCLLWLVIEYYQFPVLLYFSSVGRKLSRLFR